MSSVGGAVVLVGAGVIGSSVGGPVSAVGVLLHPVKNTTNRTAITNNVILCAVARIVTSSCFVMTLIFILP
jgi:hypothetical protein